MKTYECVSECPEVYYYHYVDPSDFETIPGISLEYLSDMNEIYECKRCSAK
jgi:hypothetical protein